MPRNNLIWHTNIATRAKVDAYNERSIATMRGSDQSEYADYPNATRAGPIELRYRGTERLDKLRRLKKAWDSSGVFTHQLLE